MYKEIGTNIEKGQVIFGESMAVLRNLKSSSVDLIYIDPPQSNNKSNAGTWLARGQSENENRTDFLRPRLEEAYRVLAPNGSLYLHCDSQEVHYLKVLCDEIFGSHSFINDIILAYDYLEASSEEEQAWFYDDEGNAKWSVRHENILFYAKDPKNYIFNFDNIEREPFMAPNMITASPSVKGVWLSDTWWQTTECVICQKKTEFATRTPLSVLTRILTASSNPGDLVLDFFAGSGTTGEAAYLLKRQFILVDNNLEALKRMDTRFPPIGIKFVGYEKTFPF